MSYCVVDTMVKADFTSALTERHTLLVGATDNNREIQRADNRPVTARA